MVIEHGKIHKRSPTKQSKSKIRRSTTNQHRLLQKKQKLTPLKLNIAPQEWWLEGKPFLLGRKLFRGDIR